MMPAGLYYVGDLCYVMHPEWDEFCQITLNSNSSNNGEFQLKNGVKFASYGTMYGDGTYFDEEGSSYGVDAGLIGCVRIEDLSEKDPDFSGGKIIEFYTDFETSEVDGTIYIGHVKINTDEDEDEDENED
jgi:hypothetical protein